MFSLRLTLLALVFVTACAQKSDEAKYLVTTKVQIKEGKIPDVLQLFKSTNPGLVEGQEDWVKAVFSANDGNQMVMVQAYWKSKEAYLTFSQSAVFKNTMKGFGPFFAGKPSIEINEILFEM